MKQVHLRFRSEMMLLAYSCVGKDVQPLTQQVTQQVTQRVTHRKLQPSDYQHYTHNYAKSVLLIRRVPLIFSGFWMFLCSKHHETVAKKYRFCRLKA